MNNILHRIIEIKYCPYNYIHKDYLNPFFPNVDIYSETLINYWINNELLYNEMDCNWCHNDKLTLSLIKSWYEIPRITYFVGGYLLRESLLLKCKELLTDHYLLSFISLPIIHSVKLDKNTPPSQINNVGLSFIMNFSSILPDCFTKRILLHFPPSIYRPDVIASITPQNINLLLMAINHANTIKK